MRNLRLILSGAALVCVTACSGQSSNAPASAASAPPDVWAVVDGRQIKKDDVDKAYKRAMSSADKPSDDEALLGKLSLLNEMIVQDILVARAAAMKVTVTDTEVDNAFL